MQLFTLLWALSPEYHLALDLSAWVARTARIQRAKRLVDQTQLPTTGIAHQSGFHRLRSFNAAFQQLNRRAPSSLRR